MAEAETGIFRCDPFISDWSIEGWDNGKGCVRKCEELGRFHGAGCCEARYKGSTTYCRYGKFLAKGYSDTRAVNCIGICQSGIRLRLIIFYNHYIMQLSIFRKRSSS